MIYTFKAGEVNVMIKKAMWLGLIVCLLCQCSIKKIALRSVANALTAPGGGEVFSADNDPELVGDALPFAIKLYESLLAMLPDHQGLQLMTGSLYVMYANAFIYVPASMLSTEEYSRQEFMYARAKNLYLRGRNILLNGLDKRHKGFLKELQQRNFKTALAKFKKEEIDVLYWTAAGWLGAYAIDPFDSELGLSLPQAEALIHKVHELDNHYENGTIHDFYVTYYGSLPDYMGGSFEKARHHFQLAIDQGNGKATSPYLSLATSVSVSEQNLAEFKELLNKVVQFDANTDIKNRLLHTLNIRKANWLLAHADKFFLIEENEAAGRSIEETNQSKEDQP
jgi:predicted anti-sigma-YlaC factor YlaD